MPVRRATTDDLPRLEAIRAVALPESSSTLLTFGVRGPPVALVACAPDGTVVGYALAMRDERREQAYLAELAVAPGHRREGYGRALVDAVARECADHVRLVLTTRSDDERARAFYRALGFEPIESLPEHYEDADGVALGRDL